MIQTYQPKKRQRKKVHGFRQRMKSARPAMSAPQARQGPQVSDGVIGQENTSRHGQTDQSGSAPLHRFPCGADKAE